MSTTVLLHKLLPDLQNILPKFLFLNNIGINRTLLNHQKQYLRTQINRCLFSSCLYDTVSHPCNRINSQSIRINRFYSRHTTLSGVVETLNQSEAAKRKAAGKKTAEPDKILLVSETENILLTTLAEAEKIAKKKGVYLIEVKEMESKFHTDKKVYKMESSAQHFGDDWKHKNDGSELTEIAPLSYSLPKEQKEQRKKEDKTILFKSKISAHDIQAKVKQMNKMIEKGHVLRVFIGGVGSAGDPDFVFRGIQSQLTRFCKIQQKKVTGTEIRFQIVPVTPDESEPDAGEPKPTKKNSDKSLKDLNLENTDS